MSRPKIPPRQPIGDIFEGVLVKIGDDYLLARTELAGGETVRAETFTVRYGVVYLIEAMYSIVPGLIALDYGDFLTGAEAWHFLFKKSNLHPRADVLGYRNDGEDDMVPIKRLDLEHPVDVMVYADGEATTPLATVKALITPSPDNIAERLLEYLPQYPTLEAWQEAQA